MDLSAFPQPVCATAILKMKFPYAKEAEKDYRRGYCDGFYAAMETLENVIRDELHAQMWDFLQGDLMQWRFSVTAGESRVRQRPPQTQFARKKSSATTQQGIVYIVHAEGTTRIKIGRSITPAPRLASLQTSSPYPLKVLRMIPTPDIAFLERMLHKRYAKFRRQGEWFELPVEVLEALLHEDFS